MNTPNVYLADSFNKMLKNQKQIDGKWVIARPLGLPGLYLRYRLQVAWRVFTGRYDAMEWEGQ